jgi:hypothetical protein
MDAAPGISIWGEIYNLAGEHVGTLQADAGATGLSWNLPSELASGIYLFRVSARNSAGVLHSSVVKAAIVR